MNEEQYKELIAFLKLAKAHSCCLCQANCCISCEANKLLDELGE